MCCELYTSRAPVMAAVQELNDVRQEGQDMTCSDEELPPCDTFVNSDSVTTESSAIKVIHCGKCYR